MNIRPELAPDVNMCIPKAVHARRPPYKPPHFSGNITPRFVVVQPHIDVGQIGSILCIGDCKKIVVMWPPTTHNLDVMRKESGYAAIFQRVGHRLEGGIATVVDSSVALVMFTGTIHFTITLEPGILVGINWVSAECYRAGARCFQYEIDTNLEEDHSGAFEIFANQLDAALDGCDEDLHRVVFED